jgi:hypothetical protein
MEPAGAEVVDRPEETFGLDGLWKSKIGCDRLGADGYTAVSGSVRTSTGVSRRRG